MGADKFIIVGENIHCTRIYKVGGLFVKEDEAGSPIIVYKADGKKCRLPIPQPFVESNDWEDGKVKHCAVAIWQGVRGDGAAKAAGVHYLQNLARRQESAGATYLDVNVDEYSTDVAERLELMKWTVRTVQDAVAIPVSVDSSNMDVLRAGLEAADPARGRPMVNSLSLERADAIDVAAEFNAVVIASATGESGMPSTAAERVANLATLLPRLKEKGMQDADLHLDPLVFPISVDPNNGKSFLDAVTSARDAFGPEVHIVAGLSNISFGMPKRKLINQVFTYLAVQAGADGGIVDPLQINARIIEELDPNDKPFELAKALLLGEDEFGMNFITASRDGTL